MNGILILEYYCESELETWKEVKDTGVTIK